MASDNIYPDQSGGLYDIKYAQLRILASDVRRNFTQGQGGTTVPGGGSTGETGGGDDEHIPPGGSGCKKVYVANLNQNGTDDPVATVYENTIGEIVYSRIDPGSYLILSDGLFTEGFTWWHLNNPLVEGMSNGAGFIEMRVMWIDSSTMVMVTRNSSPVDENQDSMLLNASLEIRTYCQDDECVAVAQPEFSLPDAFLGIPYLFEYELTGTAPMTVSIDTAPSWMSIEVIGNILTISGTPDATLSSGSVSFSISNCGGANSIDIGTFISVADLDSMEFTITHESEFFEGGASQQFFQVTFGASGTTGAAYIDWGDGTIEPIVAGPVETLHLSHAYDPIGTYTQKFYFTNNEQILTFNNFDGSPGDFHTLGFFNSTNMTNFNGSRYIANIMNFPSCFPTTVGSSPVLIFCTGHADNTETTLDLSIIGTSVTNLSIENFPLVTTITNIPSTISGLLSLGSMPSCNSLQNGGSFPAATNISFQGFGGPVAYGTFNYTNIVSFVFSNSGLSTSDVNAFAVGVDGNGLTNGTFIVSQGGGAAPSGAGAAAVTSLAGKGWTTITD